MRVTFPVTLNLLSFMTPSVQLENYVEKQNENRDKFISLLVYINVINHVHITTFYVHIGQAFRKLNGQRHATCHLRQWHENLMFDIHSFIHSFSSLSYDRSTASSKASSPHRAIQSFLLQMRVSSPFLKVIQQFPTSSSSSSFHFYPPLYLSFNNSLQKAVSTQNVTNPVYLPFTYFMQDIPLLLYSKQYFFISHTISPTDLFHPSLAPHFKTFQVFLIYCPKRPSFSTI